MPFTPRVFSGTQPSGDLHLGNYLGAIKRYVEMQKTHECLYCVVDMHAITVWQEPDELRRATREVAAAYVAAGVDPRKNIVFNQSRVVQHAELAWVFNCVARMGWMARMTQFKDKTAGKNAENVSLGLFAYPALMAADILLYKATHVPVGEDQRQHLELTRDVAKKFNHDFGADYFPVPETLYQGPGARIMSLRDGMAKMSKSDPSDNSRINLTDEADTIAAKIKKAKSDADVLPESAEGLESRPEAKNLVGIYAALAGVTVADVLKDFGGKGFGAFKPALAEVVVAKMAPISQRLRGLLADPAEIDRVLKIGANRANEVAAPVVRDVKKIVGLWG